MNENIRPDPPEARSNRHTVLVIGTNRLQNDLLARFLTTAADINCLLAQGDDLDEIDPENAGNVDLVLIDCFKADDRLLAAAPLMAIASRFPGCVIALFNVNPEDGLERWAVEKGIRGIFYRNDPLPILSKGVTEIVKGELWYSRKTMSRFLLEKGSFAKLSRQAATSLTFREREILVGIASGASNKEIAVELGISLHTVKTHIYNIYKKIKVPNRLQAAFWAAQYL